MTECVFICFGKHFECGSLPKKCCELQNESTHVSVKRFNKKKAAWDLNHYKRGDIVISVTMCVNCPSFSPESTTLRWHFLASPFRALQCYINKQLLSKTAKNHSFIMNRWTRWRANHNNRFSSWHFCPIKSYEMPHPPVCKPNELHEEYASEAWAIKRNINAGIKSHQD